MSADATPAVTEAIDDYLDAQREVLTRDPHALYDGNGVHKTRVAARRYRSVLRVFADRFDPGTAEHLDSELFWYSSLLGNLRDLQVLRAHFADAIDDLPEELGAPAGLGARIDAGLKVRERQALRAVRRALVSRRREVLLAAVVAAPLLDGERPLDDYLTAAEQKARKRLRQADKLDAHDPNRDPAMHRARKAAKRARYTAELCVPAFGGRAKKSVRKWRKIQDELGEHQDGVVAAEFLRTLAGDDTDFMLGVMWVREILR
jgi:CHAD domain-containing protein